MHQEVKYNTPQAFLKTLPTALPRHSLTVFGVCTCVCKHTPVLGIWAPTLFHCPVVCGFLAGPEITVRAVQLHFFEMIALAIVFALGFPQSLKLVCFLLQLLFRF